MTRFTTGLPWLDEAFPEGLDVPSSTVITGPGGAGKPIIALGYVSAWLQQGGSVISAPLQFPDPDFISGNLVELYGVDPAEYAQDFLHVEFDPDIEGIQEVSHDHLKANVVTPDTWALILDEADSRFEDDELGTLFFATALNLPLFSRTYRAELLETFEDLFDAGDVTTLFCLSTSMIEDVARSVASLSDNLLFADPLDDHETLHFRVDRATDVPFSSEDLEAPFTYEQLTAVKDRSDDYRVTPMDKIRAV